MNCPCLGRGAAPSLCPTVVKGEEAERLLTVVLGGEMDFLIHRKTADTKKGHKERKDKCTIPYL